MADQNNVPGLSPFDEGSLLTAFGKTVNTSAVNIGSEFDMTATPEPETPAPEPTPAPPAPPAPAAEPEEKQHIIEVNGVKQVFKYKTEAELVEQLSKAQEHATKKIADQANKLKAKPSKDPAYTPIEVKARELTLQEKADLVNLAKTDLTAAVDKIIEARLGAPIDVISKAISDTNALMQNQAIENAKNAFFAEHPECANLSFEDGAKFGELLKREGLPVTVNNLNYAYQQLLESGAISTAAQPVAPAPAAPPQPEVKETPPPPVSIPAGHGQPAPTATESEGVDVRKLQSMPLPQMKAELAKILKRNGSAAPR